jgi:hypothetical protein
VARLMRGQGKAFAPSSPVSALTVGLGVGLTVARDRLSLGLLEQSFVRGLASEPPVRSVVVVAVLPFLESLVEQAGVVLNNTVE